MAGKDKKNQPQPIISPTRAEQIASNAMASETKNVGVKSVDKKPLKQVNEQRGRDFQYIVQANGLGTGFGYADVAKQQTLQAELKPSKWALDFAQKWNTTPEYIKDRFITDNADVAKVKQNLFGSKDWATASVETKAKALTEAAKLTPGGPFGDGDVNFSGAFLNNPELALAAANAMNSKRVTKRQMNIINNAVDMLDVVSKISVATSETTRSRIWNDLSKQQQNAVVSLATAIADEYKTKFAASQNQSENPIISFLGATVGTLADGLLWMNDQAQHVYRSVARGIETGDNIMTAWNDTANGQIDKVAFENLKKKYGELAPEVVRDTIQLSGTENGFAELVDKYKGNDAALQIIDQILIADERSPEIQALIKEYNFTRRDDLGNMIANKIVPESSRDNMFGEAIWSLTDMGVNFTATWFGDPTLIAGKFIKGYKLFKYGLAKDLGAVGNIEKVLSQKKVKRLFDGLSNEVIKINYAKDIREVTKIKENIKVAYGKYVTDDAVDSMAKFFKENQGRFPNRIQTINAWMREANGIDKLLMGKPVHLDQFLMPRMTKARQKYINLRLKNKKVIKFDGSDDALIAAVVGDASNPEFVKATFGTDDIAKLQADPEFASLMQQAQVQNAVEMLSDEFGRALIAEKYGIVPDSLKFGRFDTAKEGLYKRGNYAYRAWNVSREAWAFRTDKWLRNLETAPHGRSIIVEDASDADQIYAWARTTFSKHFSNQLRELWKVADEGQRRLMLSGIFETIADARGITKINETQRLAREEIITSSMRKSEEYAATQSVVTKNALGEDIVTRYNPAEVNGRKHALHVAQTARAVTVPNFYYVQQVTTKVGLLNKILGLSFRSDVAKVTDLWSFFNIAGPRYVQRAALEDAAGGAASGVGVLDYIAGKQLTNAIREPRGKTTGLLGETSRMIGDSLPQGSAISRFIANNIFKRHLSKDEIIKAQKALQENRVKEFRDLSILSLSRMKLTNKLVAVMNPKIAKYKEQALADYASLGDEGLSLLDEVAEVGRDLNSFVVNDAKLAVRSSAMRKDLKGTQFKSEVTWDDILTFEKDEAAAYTHFYGQLHYVLHTDGEIGQQVFNAMRQSKNVAEAKKIALPKIIDDINNGKINRSQFSMFKEPGMTVEDFASRYFDDSARYFAMSDGKTVNRKLIDAVTRTDEELSTTVKAKQNIVNIPTKTFEELSPEAQGYAKTLSGFRDSDYIKSILEDYVNTGADWEYNLAVNLDIETAIKRSDFEDLVKYYYGQTQKSLDSRFPDSEYIAVWRKGRENEFRPIVSTTTREGGLRDFQPSVKYYVKKSDVLLDTENVIKNAIYDEKELLIPLKALITEDDFAKISNVTNENAIGRLYLVKGADEIDTVDIDFLRSLKETERPAYVLGRKRDVSVLKDGGDFDKAWQLMSDSLARATREPMFFARYVKEYAEMQPLIKMYMEQGASYMTARKMVRDLAVKRAEYIALSYMDNPAIRSLGAYNARNLARYYRATEDFYRRAVRVTKYNPEALQKLNLINGVLEDSGFFWEDENGEQYFIYPGTGVLHQAMATVFNIAHFGSDMITTTPFLFAGKTTFLTPSADPNSFLPTFASPLSGASIKMLTALGPFKELDGWLLGSRGAQIGDQPTGVFSGIFDSIVPSHIKRAMALQSFDERNSQYAAAVRGAIQVLAHNGEISPDKIKTLADQNALMDKVANTSLGVLITRFALGFVLPASPQLLVNDATSIEARKLGVKSLRQGFIQLLDKYNGDTDKAITAWYKINPNLMPFTVSSTEYAGGGTPSYTDQAGEWLSGNKDFVAKHPNAVAYIAPQAGEYTYKTYGLIKSLGYIKNKEISKYLVDIVTVNDYFVYQATKKDYEAARENAITEKQRYDIDQKWKNIKASLLASNPYLEDRLTPENMGKASRIRKQSFEDTAAAIREIYTDRKDLISKTTDKLNVMIATFQDAKNEFVQYKAGDTEYYTSNRERIRTTLKSLLTKAAGKDKNAINFFNNVLDGLIEEW